MTDITDTTYVWHGGQHPPDGMAVKQVYGYVFDDQARLLLLRDPAGIWNLPGGTPEPQDGGDHLATLEREVWEEVQARLTDPVYLGYQTVHIPEQAPYAQLRMAARLTELGERAPDPDHGHVHVRHRCGVTEAEALLDWGRAAQPQIQTAAKAARERWGLDINAPVRSLTD
ncbi:MULTISPECIES: NUDIX hydrolase [unclassified Nocardiopsis]|uniref:NUDIX hydrolase n=1 Tax=unclassified Nocardiopsis TaxID=2649073 RepID=UPI00135A96B0|nr:MULTISPECIES: NUDIX hydrolase [unclassified Nocardiopsis]